MVSRSHGMKGTSIYEVWHHMKQRCNGTSGESSKYYKGRGIGYDPTWDNFEDFYRDMSQGYSKGLQLDRINNDLGYSKENCRWATSKTNNNNKRNNVFIEHDGESKTLAQWCDEFNVPYQRVSKRWLKYGVREFDKLFSANRLQSEDRKAIVCACTICGREDGTLRQNGLPRRTKDGKCNTCYHREMRRKRKTAQEAHAVRDVAVCTPQGVIVPSASV